MIVQNNEKKRIVLTNDDGIESSYLLALYTALLPEYECIVVAPAEERSATSHAISLNRHIEVEPFVYEGKEIGYRVWGTPADCVKLALCELLSEKPDLIVSGVNRGANVGVSVYYSGTVSAAREGALVGIPSLALSIAAGTYDLDYVCRQSKQFIDAMMRQELPRGIIVNINFPACMPDSVKGIKHTCQAASYFKEWFDKHERDACRVSYLLKGDMQVHDEEEENDVRALEEQYISITPLKIDLTDYNALSEISQVFSLRSAGTAGNYEKQ